MGSDLYKTTTKKCAEFLNNNKFKFDLTRWGC